MIKLNLWCLDPAFSRNRTCLLWNRKRRSIVFFVSLSFFPNGVLTTHMGQCVLKKGGVLQCAWAQAVEEVLIAPDPVSLRGEKTHGIGAEVKDIIIED